VYFKFSHNGGAPKFCGARSNLPHYSSVSMGLITMTVISDNANNNLRVFRVVFYFVIAECFFLHKDRKQRCSGCLQALGPSSQSWLVTAGWCVQADDRVDQQLRVESGISTWNRNDCFITTLAWTQSLVTDWFNHSYNRYFSIRSSICSSVCSITHLLQFIKIIH